MSAPLADRYDVVVVGAGPAGLACATACAGAGLSTVLLDEQASPGGQVYRAITDTPIGRGTLLGEDYWKGSRLAEDFAASGARYVPGATVWSLAPSRELGVSVGGGSAMVQASRVVLATGALERPFPVPGWTLPGVMTAGAGQILLKSSGLVPEGPTVLAGCGPLLWLLAWQYLEAGATVDAILDTTPVENRALAFPHAFGFLLSPYFAKGLALMLKVRRHVPVIGGVTAIEAQGGDRVESVAFRVHDRAPESLPVSTLLLHQGVVPNVNLAMSVGIAHRWDDSQLAFVPELDAFGGSSVPGIAIAGDGAGIAGAQAAQFRGLLAAIAAIRELKPGAAQPNEHLVRAQLASSLAGRRFLDTLYRPAKAFRQPAGDTIVCRCEEITARQVVDTVALGCPGPNQMKSFLRCGMGPCQGRLCGLTVTELIAEARGVPPQAVGHYRLRPPVKPITVAELAALPRNEAAVKAVVRI